jgi:hypothetical protein
MWMPMQELCLMRTWKINFFVGAAIYNTMKHKENVLNEEFKIPTRYTLQQVDVWM